jgi:protein-L-isoaspartate(D-aspartate) O-methyltransferase
MTETLTYPSAIDFAAERHRMVEVQLASRGLRDRLVLDAMREVPRGQFVDPGFEEFAYEDSPLPIGAGQTISQPYIVALMLEAAEIRPGARVLEVGDGSGYAAAVASRIVARVYAIERHASLADGARRRLRPA